MLYKSVEENQYIIGPFGMWVCIGLTALNKTHQILSSIQKLSDEEKLHPNESNNFHSNISQDVAL